MSNYSCYMWAVPDWRSDEMHWQLDNREKGIYRELIDECWITGSISSDPEDLARFVHEPIDYFIQVWAKIRHKFRHVQRSHGTKLMSPRLDQDRRRLETVRSRRRVSAEKGAKMRWLKHKEMNEVDAKRIVLAPQIQIQTHIHNKEEEKKNTYGSFQNVKLTDTEYDKLKIKLNGLTEIKIEALSEYIASKGVRYKSHYATILMWSRNDDKKEGQRERSNTADANARAARDFVSRKLAETLQRDLPDVRKDIGRLPGTT